MSKSKFQIQKILAFLKQKSGENKNIVKQPFKFLICMVICIGSIYKIFNISRHNCRMDKSEAL